MIIKNYMLMCLIFTKKIIQSEIFKTFIYILNVCMYTQFQLREKFVYEIKLYKICTVNSYIP